MIKRVGCLMMLVVILGGCANLRSPSGESGDDNSDWPVVWQDVDGDCQETRTEVLIREHKGLIQWADPMACHILKGQWQSWGRDVVVGPASVWVVPLVTPANAVESGAKNWSRETKIGFINDQDNLIVLDPVSATERRGYGPDRWIPLKQYWCEYARRWQKVKKRYALTISQDERGALDHMLATCPDNAPGQKRTPTAE